MKSGNRIWAACAAIVLIWQATAFADMQWGGIVKPERDSRLRLTAGVLFEFEGKVAETQRKLYSVIGREVDQRDAESYNLDDFDLNDVFGMIGLSYDVAWRWFRLQVDTSFMMPSASTTAQRDYYLTINDDIPYNGGSYDHLMIPEGSPFSADLFGNLTELTMMFVPVGFQVGDWLTINPSLDLGVLLFGGFYEIDAGESIGVKTYQNPPEDFVIGGKADGFAGIGVPQWGVGVDMQFGRPGGVNFDLQAHYLFSNYDGSTAYFTSSSHREKNLDFDHSNIRIRGEVEFPVGRRTMIAGLQVQMIDTQGTLESKETDPAKIIENRERFDKEFGLKVHSVLATVGFAF
ncbi:MAG: hypothetical protein LBN38_03770 [Verrucomicrobiota bacterium]|jgi:hypothetical protein|nr:hypothetical protein [Verrucomicrobiota bacterium]